MKRGGYRLKIKTSFLLLNTNYTRICMLCVVYPLSLPLPSFFFYSSSISVCLSVYIKLVFIYANYINLIIF